MAVQSKSTIYENLGIETASLGEDEVNYSEEKRTTQSKNEIYKDLGILDSVEQKTSSIENEGFFKKYTGRGLLDWLSVGENFGVGYIKNEFKSLQDLRTETTLTDKLKSLWSATSVPGIIAGVKGIKEQAKLKDFLKEDMDLKLTRGQEFAADIAQIFVDPSLYASFGLSKLPVIGLKYAKKAPIVGKAITKGVDYLGEKFIFKYGAPIDYTKRAAERLMRIARGRGDAIDMAKKLSTTQSTRKILGLTFTKTKKLSLEEQQTIGDIITGTMTNADPVLVQLAEPAIEVLEKLGKDAVESGLMTQAQFLKRAGKYMPRLYRKYETADRLSKFFSKDIKLIGERFSPRADTWAITYKESLDKFAKPIMKFFDTEEEMLKYEKMLKNQGMGKMIVEKMKPMSEKIRNEMGEIKEAAYPVAKGIADLTYDIETAKFFKWIKLKYAKEFDETGNLVQLSDSKALGELSNQYVPKYIANDIEAIIEKSSSSMKTYTKLLNAWKVGKTILNPAYHGRNIISNLVLNTVNGVHLADPRALKAYAIASKELKHGGKYFDEAEKAGLLSKTFYNEELKDFIDPISEESIKGISSWIKNMARKSVDKAGEFQTFNEDFAKLAHFIFKRKRGVDIDTAVKEAKRAIFDYGEITNLEQKIKKFIPFYTFSRKAYPRILQIAVDSPGKIGQFNQLINAVGSLSDETEEEQKWLAPWMRNKFMVRLPMKDKDNNSTYFDVTYILPWGDALAALNEGGIEGLGRNFTLMMTPFLKEVIEQGMGKDLYFDKEIELFRNQKLLGTIPIGNRYAHILRTFAPQIYSDVSEKLIPSLRGDVDYAGRDISFPQEVASMIGLKTVKVNLGKQKESMPYVVGEMVDEYDNLIYQAKKDKNSTEEERAKEIEKWTKKKNKILTKYKGIPYKKKLWIDAQ